MDAIISDKRDELRPEWLACYQGFPIYINRELPPGCVELRNSEGKVLARITDVGAVLIASERS